MSVIDRPEYDESGSRLVTCHTCGMCWFEYREPVELLPGSWTGSGQRDHECPPPFPYKTAKMMADQAQATRGGIVVSQRTKARIKLGLALGDPTSALPPTGGPS